MDGAHGVLLSIAGGSDLGLFEINEAASLVQEAAHEDANIIFGTVIDDSLGDEVRVTVIAAGFDSTPSVLPPTIDQRAARATAAAGGFNGAAGGGFNGGFNGSQPAARPQQPAQPQYTSAPPPAARPPAPAYAAPGTPAGHYPPQGNAPSQHQSVRPGTRPAAVDDDDVDVPSFMRR